MAYSPPLAALNDEAILFGNMPALYEEPVNGIKSNVLENEFFVLVLVALGQLKNIDGAKHHSSYAIIVIDPKLIE